MSSRGRNYLGVASILSSLAVLTVVFAAHRDSQAQASPCPTERPGPRFPPGVQVYLDINSPIRGTSVGGQIVSAADQWTAANTGQNGSGTTFNTSTPLNQVPPSAPVLHVAFAALYLEAPAAGPDIYTRAVFRINGSNGIYITDATILFNTNAATDPNGFNLSPYYDPQAPAMARSI